jgi:hypothetical protein
MLKMKQVIDDLLSGKMRRELARRERQELRSAVVDLDAPAPPPAENDNTPRPPYGNTLRGH